MQRDNTGLAYSMQGDHLYVRAVTTAFPSPSKEFVRGEIKAFSLRSGSRMRRFLRCCNATYTILGTLTYGRNYPKDGRVAKDHLRALLQRIRRYLGSDPGFSLFWFLEFQERGAPHFHFFTNRRLPKEKLAVWWYEIVGSREENHLLAGTRIESLRLGRRGTIGYARKYAAKASQKSVPEEYEHVGRFWGAIGDVSCNAYFLFVKADAVLHPRHVLMKARIKEALEQRKSGWKWIRFGKGTPIKGVYFFDQVTRDAVKAILLQAGMLLHLTGKGVSDYPAQGCLENDVV